MKRRFQNPISTHESLDDNKKLKPSRTVFENDVEDENSDTPSPIRKPTLFIPSIPSHSSPSPPSPPPSQSKPPDSLEPDPLDVFMQGIHNIKPAHRPTNSQPSEVPNYEPVTEIPSDDDRSYKPRRVKRHVYEKVDHSKVNYPPFQKNLYIQVPELSKMTYAQVAALRRSLGNVRIRGKRCPTPITAWPQCGLSTAVLSVLERLAFSTPTPIQAQAIPCVMSGRDVIGVARTGSGKTLAFLLPAFRHVALQPRAMPGEGPAVLVVAPTRELAIQIYGDAKKFSRAVDVRCVCAYGGSGVKDQIAELKRGADIVICTPGRMIDLLAMNGGRITNLRRVTFVVLDEADRMFDMGFEPQLTRIVENIRPDRQTVMFSATFPVQVEKLARKVLKQPVEIVVGGNSIAPASISQFVEVRSEDSKFFRLLELLGTWYEVGSTLIFVDRQDNADRIFRELSNARYKCLSLHGGMDQADRDSTIVDFKNGDVKVLVATSVAARGLDVKNLTLVVNFDVPSHYEDYVHRVGRTGRAGNTGTAYTFITPEQESFAPDIAKALALSARAIAEQEAPVGDLETAKKAGDEAAEAAIPEDLRRLVESFELKKKAGLVKYGASSGYGGRGFKFEENDDYDAAKSARRKMQAKQYGMEVDGEEYDVINGNTDEKESSDDDEEDDGIVAISAASKAGGLMIEGGKGDANGPNVKLSSADVSKMLADAVKKAERSADMMKMNKDARRSFIAKATANVLSIATLQNKTSSVGLHGLEKGTASAVTAAAAAAAAINAKISGGSALGNGRDKSDTLGGDDVTGGSEPRFAGELEINDYPQHARWQVTRKNACNDVEEFTGCVITTRGNFYPVGRNPPPGERKLHFLIEGPSRRAVKTARRDIRQKLDEAAAVTRPADSQYSKYSVV